MNCFKKVIFTIALITSFNLRFSYAVDNSFIISPINSEEKKQISALFKTYETKWVSAKELEDQPGAYWQDDLKEQSFKISSNQPSLEDVYFVPIQADYKNGIHSDKNRSQNLSLLLIDRKNRDIKELPKHPVLTWNFFEIKTVAFRDLQGDGKRCIIVNAAGMTGVGPDGANPFDVYAIYIPEPNGTWRMDEKLHAIIAEKLYRKCKDEKCRSINEVIKVAKNYFKELKK